MTKKPLYIAHANGFPGGSYRVISDLLTASYQVHWCDMFAHKDEYPVSNNWPHLVQELISNIEQLNTEPVHLVGHSLGGALAMRVSQIRPDLVASMIILDSPLLTRVQALSLRLSKQIGLTRWYFPIERTLDRRQCWPNSLEAVEYFRSRRLMADFDQRCLVDYVNAATHKVDSGIKLRFDPKIEAKIWQTIPDDFHPKRFKVPAAVIGGRSSRVFRSSNARLMNYLGMKVIWMQGSHLFPFEYPELTANHIDRLIRGWQTS